ncbi:MAG TPA: molybdopterin-binding oxidoreductase [Caulobacteraceae bacterium]|jgi:hypothetical protein|nr:molybdopterin-binding oxidoreductase [Caulobacteraceae bacterium]
MIRLAAAVMATLGVALATAASAQGVSVTGLSGQRAELTAADLAAMPHLAVTLQLEGGKSEACEGVALSDILAKVGAPQGHALRGPEMTDAVLVGAADGYHVVLALAETDPGVRTNRVILADKCDGAAMVAPEGPFRMVVEGDLRPARSARQVTSITVVRVMPPAR